MPDIEFLFDFASPNAYLAYRTLPKMAQEAGVGIRYIPCLLGGIFKLTNNQAPMIAYANIKPKLAYERLEFQRFVERHKLSDFTFNPHFPVVSLLLMRGIMAATERGEFDAYLEAGMVAMWEEGEKMSEPDVYSAVLTRHGLDGAYYLEQTQDPDIKSRLAKATDAAVARGVFGIPTFFVGEEMFFGKERLGQVLEQATA